MLAALFVVSYAALSSAAVRDQAAEPAAVAAPLPVPVPPAPEPEPRATPEPRPDLAIVRRSVPLRARPNGRVVAHAGARTEFGGRRVLGVAARRGPWLGVVVPELPNGKLAWVNRRHRGLDLGRTAYSLHADLSGRWLELRRNGRPLRRITVAVGRPGSDTPTGRFAVTDKLSGSNYGPYYGCCILALNGKQPNLPPGWQGGNRLAIHGTDSPGTIGAAASAGCLRAGDSDLQVLMRRVPLGTPVFVRN
jgi:hypothetical protein